MKSILLGHAVEGGKPVTIDIARLVESRMLLQASSGFGKSHAIRRILEQSFGLVQHLIFDIEGEFYTLREKFPYALVAVKGGEATPDPRYAATLARTFLESEASAIIDLSDIPIHERHRFVRLFIEALLDAPKEMRHACLVVVDEAHVLCPEKHSSEAGPWVANLMAQGRKRGLAGILATQRLAKLDKDAAAEAHIKLVGKATLDDDVKRSADELGWGKKDHARIRFLKRGQFFIYGPGVSEEGVTLVQVGETQTKSPKFGGRIAPVPPTPAKVKAMLGERLAGLPQEAEAEAKTVEELKAVVASQKREMARLKSTQPAPVKEKRVEVEVPVLGKRDSGRILRLDKRAQALLVKAGMIANGGSEFYSAAKTLADEVIELKHRITLPPATKPVTLDEAIASLPRSAAFAKEHPEAAALIPRTPVDGISGAQQRILDSIAWWNAAVPGESPDSVQVAFMAGYTVNGHFNNMRGALRSAGLIEHEGGRLRLTAQGHAIASPSEVPQNLKALHDRFLARLGSAEQRILKVLLGSYPGSLPSARLAELAGFTVNGHFNNCRGRLSSLGLAEYPRSGWVIASKRLFPEGLVWTLGSLTVTAASLAAESGRATEPASWLTVGAFSADPCSPTGSGWARASTTDRRTRRRESRRRER